MKNITVFFAVLLGISSITASEQITLETPAIETTSSNEPVVVTTEKTDPLINLPTSIEISVKFPATVKKPEPHSVDLVLSKSTLATLSNYGAQAVTWAYEQTKEIVHKAAVFTAEATKPE